MSIYLDGDPSSDSTRRRLERLLREERQPQRSRKWMWLAMLTAGGSWAFWLTTRKSSTESAVGRQKISR